MSPSCSPPANPQKTDSDLDLILQVLAAHASILQLMIRRLRERSICLRVPIRISELIPEPSLNSQDLVGPDVEINESASTDSSLDESPRSHAETGCYVACPRHLAPLHGPEINEVDTLSAPMLGAGVVSDRSVPESSHDMELLTGIRVGDPAPGGDAEAVSPQPLPVEVTVHDGAFPRRADVAPAVAAEATKEIIDQRVVDELAAEYAKNYVEQYLATNGANIVELQAEVQRLGQRLTEETTRANVAETQALAAREAELRAQLALKNLELHYAQEQSFCLRCEREITKLDATGAEMDPGPGLVCGDEDPSFSEAGTTLVPFAGGAPVDREKEEEDCMADTLAACFTLRDFGLKGVREGAAPCSSSECLGSESSAARKRDGDDFRRELVPAHCVSAARKRDGVGTRSQGASSSPVDDSRTGEKCEQVRLSVSPLQDEALWNLICGQDS